MTKDMPSEESQSLFSQPQYSDQNYQPVTLGHGPGSNQTASKKLDHEASPPYPGHYSPAQSQINRNIVELKIPNGLECDIDRNSLIESPVHLYSKEVFQSDNAKIHRWVDYLIALLGPIGIAFILGGFLLIVWTSHNGKLSPWYPMMLGVALVALYLVTFIKPVFVCCCYSDQMAVDRMISGSFARATFQRRTSDLDSVKASINTCQNDIPQLLVTVICSDTHVYHYANQNNSDFDKTVVFRETYSLPIAHYRFLGTSNRQFLSTVDEIHSGDCTIEFIPELIMDSEQEDYLQEFVSAVYAANKGKAAYCNVFARFVCGQYDSNGIYTRPNMLDELSVYYERNHYVKQAKGDLVIRATHISTSLGSRTEFYQANGKTASSFLRCMASPFTWTLGAISCLFVLCMPFFQCRWKHLTYHSVFHVIFPKIDQVLDQFKLNPDDFIARPPEIVNDTSLKPWTV